RRLRRAGRLYARRFSSRQTMNGFRGKNRRGVAVENRIPILRRIAEWPMRGNRVTTRRLNNVDANWEFQAKRCGSRAIAIVSDRNEDAPEIQSSSSAE